MTTQPEALRLADELAAWEFSSTGLCGKSAAELRRLSAENAMLWGEREEPHAKITMYIGEWYRLETERDALLEALRALVRNEGLDAYSYLDKGIGTATAAGQRWLNARAAIAKAEGEEA